MLKLMSTVLFIHYNTTNVSNYTWNFYLKNISNNFEQFFYPTVLGYKNIIDVGYICKIRLVHHLGVTLGQCISIEMKVKTVIKLLNC